MFKKILVSLLLATGVEAQTNGLNGGTVSPFYPLGIITNGQTNVTLSGTFSGNGAGLTNILLKGTTNFEGFGAVPATLIANDGQVAGGSTNFTTLVNTPFTGT